LSRTKGQKFNGDILSFSDEDRRSIKILDDLIYSHQVLQVYYTTYDMRRDQSSINPRAHADILVSGYDDSTSPPSMLMWHARVIGIYHTRIQVVETGEIIEIPFLHVRWLADDENQTDRGRRLPRIGFYNASESPGDVFGFLDPAWVTCGVHLIPAFAHGRTKELLPGSSIAHVHTPEQQDVKEWVWWYVGM
jgi:hypothetical protein